VPHCLDQPHDQAFLNYLTYTGQLARVTNLTIHKLGTGGVLQAGVALPTQVRIDRRNDVLHGPGVGAVALVHQYDRWPSIVPLVADRFGVDVSRLEECQSGQACAVHRQQKKPHRVKARGFGLPGTSRRRSHRPRIGDAITRQQFKPKQEVVKKQPLRVANKPTKKKRRGKKKSSLARSATSMRPRKMKKRK